MKYNKTTLCAVLLIVLAIVIIGYFCFLAFSTSYGYSVQHSKNSSPVANFYCENKLIIVIDPGHGGVDPGAVTNNLVEKNINLDVALKVRDFLSISGYNVILTRSEDINLASAKNGSYKRNDLDRRLDIVEESDNCILVSIHMNKFESESAHGLQTFYSPNTPESLKLAECIQGSSKLLEPNNKRAVKSAGDDIYILKNVYKPAVLVECGFLSNSGDASKLSNAEYQNMLAFCIYCGILNYLGD